MYDELKKQFILSLSEDTTVTADLAITRMMRLQQLCGGFITVDDGTVEQVGTEKLDMTKDLVRTRLEGGEQVVIFHRYTAEGDALHTALLPLTKKPIGRINGQIKEEGRKNFRDLFQSGKSDIIIVQIATGAMGISLDRAHINIFYSLDFSLSNYQQARDRVMGRNQTRDVTNYFMAVKDTVDYKVMKTLKNDEDVASKVSDSWRWIMEE
jgi:SNF2 family DNA or RNA helicase